MLRSLDVNARRYFLLLILVGFAGCGPSTPRTIPVSGKITFGGQPPPALVVLTFVCLEAEQGDAKFNGTAQPKPDGSFTVTSFKSGDGLIPGKYRVDIECWKQPPSMAAPGTSHVPGTYSPQPFVVSAKESRVIANLEIPTGG